VREVHTAQDKEHVPCKSTSELDENRSVWCLADDSPTATIYHGNSIILHT
jgi:hypothetical protein